MRNRGKLNAWMSLPLVLAALLLVLWQGLHTQDSRSSRRVSGRKQQNCPREAVVKSVADGDTFTTDAGQCVRLLNIDAPERGEPLSDKAAARLRGLILRQNVLLTYDTETQDRYGRLLCHVYLDSEWVNETLIEEGLAAVYLVKPNLLKASVLIAAQKTARSRKVGIWSLPPPAPEEYYVASAKGFVFHRPSCRMARSISERNLTRIGSRDVALDRGLSACRNCGP